MNIFDFDLDDMKVQKNLFNEVDKISKYEKQKFLEKISIL